MITLDDTITEVLVGARVDLTADSGYFFTLSDGREYSAYGWLPLAGLPMFVASLRLQGFETTESDERHTRFTREAIV